MLYTSPDVLNNIINTSGIFLTVFFIMLLGMFIIQFFSAYAIYKDAKLRGHNGIYWSIYDIFIISFTPFGLIAYYFFVVKKFNDYELNVPIYMPKILIFKFIYFIIFSFVCYIFYMTFKNQLGLYYSFALGSSSFTTLLFSIITLPAIILKVAKIFTLWIIYDEANKRVPEEAIIWGLFSIFFTSITTLLFIFLVIKNKNKPSIHRYIEYGNINYYENQESQNYNLPNTNRVPAILYIYIILDICLSFGVIINTFTSLFFLI